MGYNPNIPYLQVGYIPLIPSPLIQDETAGLNKASRVLDPPTPGGFQPAALSKVSSSVTGIVNKILAEVPFGLLPFKGVLLGS